MQPTELAPAASPSSDSTLDERVDQVLGNKYRLLRRIGQGSMGVVYEAEHLVIKRTYALKLLRPASANNLDAARRFQLEAARAGRVVHENVVSVTDYDIADGVPYIVMELLRGESLRELSLRSGPLPMSQVIELGVQISRGLQAVHDIGIVHRDLKPQNVMVSRRANGADLAKLLDFGVAKSLIVDNSFAATDPGTLVGTLLYMAPEQIHDASSVDTRADVYALGVILYELLSGVPPFNAPDMHEVIAQILAARPVALNTLRPELPQALCACVERAMAPRPDARFPSADALAQTLLRCVQASDARDAGRTLSGSWPSLAADLRQRRQTLTAARASRIRPALLLSALAAVTWLAWPSSAARSPASTPHNDQLRAVRTEPVSQASTLAQHTSSAAFTTQATPTLRDAETAADQSAATNTQPDAHGSHPANALAGRRAQKPETRRRNQGEPTPVKIHPGEAIRATRAASSAHAAAAQAVQQRVNNGLAFDRNNPYE